MFIGELLESSPSVSVSFPYKKHQKQILSDFSLILTSSAEAMILWPSLEFWSSCGSMLEKASFNTARESVGMLQQALQSTQAGTSKYINYLNWPNPLQINVWRTSAIVRVRHKSHVCVFIEPLVNIFAQSFGSDSWPDMPACCRTRTRAKRFVWCLNGAQNSWRKEWIESTPQYTSTNNCF